MAYKVWLSLNGSNGRFPWSNVVTHNIIAVFCIFCYIFPDIP